MSRRHRLQPHPHVVGSFSVDGRAINRVRRMIAAAALERVALRRAIDRARMASMLSRQDRVDAEAPMKGDH